MNPSQKNVESVKKPRPEFLILGGGIIGFAVAKELRKSEKEITIIDVDKTRVETLRQEGFNALIGDISDPDLYNVIDTRNLICVAALSSNDDANTKAVANFKAVVPDSVKIISRASDTLKKEEMMGAGSGYVFVPPQIVSKTITEYLDLIETKHIGNRLAQWLDEHRGTSLGIVLHDNPDPDAISSAYALTEITKKYDIKADILYDGKVGHHENKAFINLLAIPMIKIPGPEIYDTYDSLALVDNSIPSINNSVPADQPIGIIIDHHSYADIEPSADFIDVRTNVGASATIMTKYLQQMDIPVSKELATALLFGIRTDTNDFRRNTTSADFAAASFLHPLSDHDLLTQVETPSMSVETLDILSEAIRNREVYGTILLSNVGTIRNRDTLPQAADYLLTMEGISTVVVFGIMDDSIYVSARNEDIRVHLGDVMREAFGDNAGGHPTAAGAKIPLGVFSSAKDKQILQKLVEESVVKRFLSAIGADEDGMADI
ncbi:manganese-dependent inorganic pyrophosphatase [Methanimicrococcus sp. At1]|uniref:Manganese-dependent inorganic pyrophosphatase n=1 Tax=Methanimicrococcus hacksteinii TaxID=3028293 RepID=A0ABU3VNI9_9EURY|nr:DHH family phosphoesterase [Methanimicrococcus sp. At1]MDV0444890.1 manganese-dependent inorganic pyrophosphatase [Methanimicrococcus sp. At1]